MFKRMFQIGCAVLFITVLSFPAWGGTDFHTDSTEVMARGGNGPGDGSGNGGSGPKDGSGHGLRGGGCLFPDAHMPDAPFITARGGNGGGGGGGGGNGGGNGGGTGGGHGPGDGTGNGGSGPKDGSGHGSKSGTCINS